MPPVSQITRTARTVSILFKGFGGNLNKKFRFARATRDTKTAFGGAEPHLTILFAWPHWTIHFAGNIYTIV